LRVEVPHARSFPLSISPKDIESEGCLEALSLSWLSARGV
jgi:hypothetical protein